jgi:lysozyme
MDIERIKERLRRFEGYRKYPYRCPAGYLTIGYGRNLEVKGISIDEAEMLLNNDVNETIELLLNGLEFFTMLPEQAQEVLVDMTFNMGFGGVLKFKKFLEALKNKDWEKAAQEMENSLWYKQTGNRARELVKIIRELKGGQ